MFNIKLSSYQQKTTLLDLNTKSHIALGTNYISIPNWNKAPSMFRVICFILLKAGRKSIFLCRSSTCSRLYFIPSLRNIYYKYTIMFVLPSSVPATASTRLRWFFPLSPSDHQPTKPPWQNLLSQPQRQHNTTNNTTSTL